jgi:hypothetical protein
MTKLYGKNLQENAGMCTHITFPKKSDSEQNENEFLFKVNIL